MTEPKAFLLAAGLGTRLRPLTDVLPKCLAPICGRPLLGYWLERLDRAGFSKIIVNLHHHADLVQRYVERSPYAGKVTLVYEERLLGTGGTLLANRRALEGGPVLVAHADNLSVFDPRELLRHHAQRPDGCEMTMMTFEADDPQSCGIVEVDSRGVMIGFHEKVPNPPGRIANAAIYAFEGSIFRDLQALDKTSIDLSTEVLHRMIGRAYCYPNPIFHKDIGTLESLIAAQFEFPLSCAIADVNLLLVDESWGTLLKTGIPPLSQRVRMELAKSLPWTKVPSR